MGQPPSEPGVSGYANSYMMVPRGSLGNTPWVWELNTSLGYRLAWKKVEGRGSINVNNLLNRHTITKFNENRESLSIHMQRTSTDGAQPGILSKIFGASMAPKALPGIPADDLAEEILDL